MSPAILDDIRAYRPLFWINPLLEPYQTVRSDIPVGSGEIETARARMARWAPQLANLFPDAFDSDSDEPGTIESPLVDLARIPAVLAERYGRTPGSDPGRILLKLDSHLPVSGSIKARGGFHEVLALTERIAEHDADTIFSFTGQLPGAGQMITVGSTGNLGLSIGILGAALGFSVTVHMSRDARRWKKELLRSRGVVVIEHGGDFGAAVAAGRADAAGNPRCHFVDDERSTDLFVGYAVAGRPLRRQLEARGIEVDADHPLCVYLPCGVGGGPGGVTFGLKEEFGDNVHCYFVEPTHAPAMLVGLVTERYDRISVQDLGLDNRTVADGLAVGRPSGLVAPALRRIVSGIFTVEDEELLTLVALLSDHEGYRLEPSAVAGLPGPFQLLRETDVPENAVHVIWATGGNMVPDDEIAEWIRAGHEMIR